MFTFKKHKKVGRYRSFDKDYVDIKIKKKVVGHIIETGFNAYKIMFAVKKEKTVELPADFRWVTLKQKPSSIEESKKYLQENFEKIIKQLDLYEFEN